MGVLWLVGLGDPWEVCLDLCGPFGLVIPSLSEGGREALCTSWVGTAPAPEIIQFRWGLRQGWARPSGGQQQSRMSCLHLQVGGGLAPPGHIPAQASPQPHLDQET